MDDPGGVDRLQRLGEPGAQRKDRPGGPGAVLGDRLSQGDAGHLDGGQPGRGAVRVGVDDAGGEGPVDQLGGGHFAGEAEP